MMEPGGEPLGIVAGGGDLPLRLAEAARRAGRPVFILGIEGWAEPGSLDGYPHAFTRLGGAARILALLREHGCRQVVMAGWAKRPSLAAIRPDAVGARVLARLGAAFFAGDDGLLRAVARVFAEEGFEVLAVQSVLRDILVPAGPLTSRLPTPDQRRDIARGIAVVQALGAVDVGQGCVVQQGLVLAVEAIEGTDAMLARAGMLKREGVGGVLVKLSKPGQDRRVDLPTIGPRTVENAIAAGLSGIAIEALGGIVVDRPAVLAQAEQAGLFLLAIRPEKFNPEEEITP